MRGDAASVRPEASPLARSFEPIEIFAAVLLGRLDDPHHPSVAGLAARARNDARAAIRLGRIAEDDDAALRLTYEQARADAAAIKPVREAPGSGPRWSRVTAALAALRHRQRAALALFYLLGMSIERTAAVLGMRPPEARKVVEAGVAQLVRVMGEPVDIRRALRSAGSRIVAVPAELVDAVPKPARMPRAVVRTLVGPPVSPAEQLEGAQVVGLGGTPASLPAEGSLLTDALLEQLEAEPPDLGAAPAPISPEIVPAPRARRRRRPAPRTRLAWAAAVVGVMLAALIPAGAQDAPPAEDPAPLTRVVGMEPAPAVAETQPPLVAASRMVVVARGDSLWAIADRSLGDPMRWKEIWRLNEGRRMGALRFRSPDLIMPGWRLRLPRR